MVERTRQLGHFVRGGGFWLFIVGVQTHEALATLGFALTLASSLPLARRLDWRAWRWLWAFGGWAAAAPLAMYLLPTGAGLARLIDWLALPFLILGFDALTSPDTPRWSRPPALATGAAVTLLVSCGVAGLQHFGIWPPPETFASLEWLKVPFNRVYELVPGTEHRFMAGGLLFHRLKFAHVSSLVVIVLAVVAARSTGRTRLLASGAGLAAAVSIWLFPYARMAAFSLTAGLVVVALFSLSSRRVGMAIAASAVVAAALAFALVEPLRARFLSAATHEGNGDRTALLAAGLRAIEQNPVFGVGAGQFRPQKFATADTPTHVLENPGKAHNQFVSQTAESGLLGGALFIVLLGWLAWKARSSAAPAATWAVLSFFVALSLAHDPLFQANFSMGLVMALAAALSEVFAQLPNASSSASSSSSVSGRDS